MHVSTEKKEDGYQMSKIEAYELFDGSDDVYLAALNIVAAGFGDQLFLVIDDAILDVLIEGQLVEVSSKSITLTKKGKQFLGDTNGYQKAD